MKLLSRLPAINDQPLLTSEAGVSFWGNAYVRTFLITGGLFLAASVGTLLYYIRPREAPIVLHYNVYFGVDLLGAWWQSYLLPVSGLIILLGHLILAHFLYRHKDRIAAYLILLATNFILFGILLAVGAIASVNY